MTNRECKSRTMAEMGTGEGTALPGAPSANTVQRNDTGRRNVMKSAPVPVTTQEADGYCEKAMRIASVKQLDLGNIMELSVTGQLLKWARRSNLSGRTVTTESGWMELEESQPPDSCQAHA